MFFSGVQETFHGIDRAVYALDGVDLGILEVEGLHAPVDSFLSEGSLIRILGASLRHLEDIASGDDEAEVAEGDIFTDNLNDCRFTRASDLIIEG